MLWYVVPVFSLRRSGLIESKGQYLTMNSFRYGPGDILRFNWKIFYVKEEGWETDKNEYDRDE